MAGSGVSGGPAAALDVAAAGAEIGSGGLPGPRRYGTGLPPQSRHVTCFGSSIRCVWLCWLVF